MTSQLKTQIITKKPLDSEKDSENNSRHLFDGINRLIENDFSKVNDLIQNRLYSDVVLINQVSHYIINSGGKRLRPIISLLSSRASGYIGDDHIKLAAIVEFIHTATLLHDDVVDASEKRRGKQTANAIWGNQASVLVGDFLYSRAFEMMVETNNMRVLDILAHATNTIAEGEVMQLLNCHDADTTEERYLSVIQCKTAKLFEAATQLGGVIANSSSEHEKSLALYGMHLGTAFQLRDDVLDYSGSHENIGKNLGDDLSEGKPTLPLIFAIKHGSPEQVTTVRNAIENGGLNDIENVTKAIESTGAINYTAQLAESEAKKARESLNGFPDSPYVEALRTLATFSVSRDY